MSGKINPITWEEKEAYVRQWIYKIEGIREALKHEKHAYAMEVLLFLQFDMHHELTKANILRGLDGKEGEAL